MFERIWYWLNKPGRMPAKSQPFSAVESHSMKDTYWNQAELESGLADLPLGWVKFLTSTTSSNDVAIKLAGEGAPDLSLVVAGQQTAGKGRAGRKWFSPPDASLSFSLGLRPPRYVSAQSDANNLLLRHTALGALAVCDTLQTYYQLSPQIKWPNDVLVDGKKVCGVLAEAQWMGDHLESIILGIGLNIHSEALPPESELAFPATHIQDHVQGNISKLKFLRQVLGKLLYWRSQIENPAFIQEWEMRLAFRHSWVTVVNETGNISSQPVVGKITGLDADGRLLLKDQRGALLCIEFGELRVRPI